MFLLYTDASGSPLLSDTGTKHYVLLGLCVHEGTWFALDRRLRNLKTRFCQPGQDFELHAAEFAGSITEQDEIPNFALMSWTDRRARVQALRQTKISAEPTAKLKKARRKKYARTESFIHLTRQDRSRLLEDALDLVGAHSGIRLFAEAISKAHPAVTSGAIDPVCQAFEQVVSRFDAFLRQHHAWKLQKGPRARIDNGLLVFDQDYNTEATFHSLFADFRDRGHSWGQLHHVIDVPLFASSQKLSGLQLADVCGYALRRYLDTNASPGSPGERNLQRIFHGP